MKTNDLTNRKKNYLLRVQLVLDIVNKYYISGSYARSYYKVWKNYVFPLYPICYRTLLNYIATPIPREIKEDSRRLSASAASSNGYIKRKTPVCRCKRAFFGWVLTP